MAPVVVKSENIREFRDFQGFYDWLRDNHLTAEEIWIRIFKLASGKMSNYYIDCRRTTHSCEGKFLIGQLMFNIVKNLNVQAIGGLTMGADPIACAPWRSAP